MHEYLYAQKAAREANVRGDLRIAILGEAASRAPQNAKKCV